MGKLLEDIKCAVHDAHEDFPQPSVISVVTEDHSMDNSTKNIMKPLPKLQKMGSS